MRFAAAQPVESAQGFVVVVIVVWVVVVQQPMNLVPVVHAKNVPPLGQVGWNANEDEEEEEEEEGEEEDI